MNVVERRWIRQPSGVRTVLVVVPGQAHLVGDLVDEHVVLDAGRGVTVELDDRYVADVLPGRRALQQRREVVERVRRPERVVLAVGSEDLQPAVLLLPGRERHVAGHELLDLEQIGHLLLIHSLSSNRDDQVTRPPFTPMICPVT